MPSAMDNGPRSAKAGRSASAFRGETPEEEFFKQRTSSKTSQRTTSSKGDSRYSKVDLDEFNKLMDKLI